MKISLKFAAVAMFAGAFLLGGININNVQADPAEALNPAGVGDPASISVSGDGAAFLAPDRARVTILLQDNSGALAGSGDTLTKKEKRLVDAARTVVPDVKVLSRGDRFHSPADDSSVSANSLTIVDRSITFETTKLNSVGALVETSLKNGAQALDEIEYLASEDSPPFEQAIELASSRAKAKAAAAARGLGVKLGRPLEVSVTEEPAGEAIQRDRELGRDPNRFSSKEVRVYVSAKYSVSE